MTLENCQDYTQIFIGCWAVLSALEWLANVKLFKSSGVLTWSLLRLRTGVNLPEVIDSIFGSEKTFTSFQLVRLFSGLTLLISSDLSLSVIALFSLVCTCAYTNFRACFGGDGSDQMGLIVSVGALLMSAGIYADDKYLACSGVMLVSGQAILAYFVAGASKVISPVWRSGSAVRGVMHTTTFGHAWAARITSTLPLTSFSVGWLVILTEMSFPVVLVAPPWLLTICLVGFTVFHLSNAYFMGLNSFVLSFAATYPSVIKVNFDIREAVEYLWR